MTKEGREAGRQEEKGKGRERRGGKEGRIEGTGNREKGNWETGGG